MESESATHACSLRICILFRIALAGTQKGSGTWRCITVCLFSIGGLYETSSSSTSPMKAAEGLSSPLPASSAASSGSSSSCDFRRTLTSFSSNMIWKMSAFCLKNWTFNDKAHFFCAACNALITGLYLSSSFMLEQFSAPRALLSRATASRTTSRSSKKQSRYVPLSTRSSSCSIAARVARHASKVCCRTVSSEPGALRSKTLPRR
mmetsp:Transcript_35147/g.79393  ORF Transcript_35147/g.79393 Transcript_35147/m.79393 type:complete len:206 (+) Transcript_35147:766-1383(+)